jgi:hypothetical protein
MEDNIPKMQPFQIPGQIQLNSLEKVSQPFNVYITNPGIKLSIVPPAAENIEPKISKKQLFKKTV